MLKKIWNEIYIYNQAEKYRKDKDWYSFIIILIQVYRRLNNIDNRRKQE